MLVYVTTQNEDRFVIYLKTIVCQVMYSNKELRFESTVEKLETMKDFLLNFGVRQIELRDYNEPGKGALVIRDDVFMQLDDKDTIRGITVPVFTII